jgi:hypothetical protein
MSNYKFSISADQVSAVPLKRDGSPNQKRQLLAAILDSGVSEWSTKDLRAFVIECGRDGRLVGNGGGELAQSAWRVFTFYRPELCDMGLLEWPYVPKSAGKESKRA